MGMDGGSAKYSRDHHHPSFSSALLDEIYRSTDLDQQSTSTLPTKYPNHHGDHIQRPPTCSLQSSSRSMRYEAGHLFSLNSTSCSCSPHGGLLLKPPKPIRVYQRGQGEAEEEEYQQQQQQQQHSTSQSKALNLYRDFKKHPVSPGRRFATFLNSFFSTRNTNKPNTPPYTTTTTNSNSANSSFSPSSLSINPSPSPRAKSTKRSSVRFADQPCGHKSLHDQQQVTAVNKEVLKRNLSDKNHHISEAARNLLKTYQNKVERFSKNRNTNRNSEYEYGSDNGGSDTSSDLFELDNLSPVTTATATGIHKDLPLYETTQLNSIKSCHC